MLFVERSNRTERLLEGLAKRLMLPGRDPLAASIVVVQGAGMERWIAQSIARDRGVCANIEFPFPRDFLDRVFAANVDDSLALPNPGWEPRNLTWCVAKLLAEGRDHPDFAPLARHLGAVDGDWRLVQLAQRIAHLLDQYISFRPDWLSAWASTSALPVGRDERWQARLYKEVRARIGPGHVADRALAFERSVSSSDRRVLEDRLDGVFPSAIEIFAVSTLPPLYLSVIARLASLREVHLSVLSPSRHYWADLWREVKAEEATASPLREVLEAGVFDGVVAAPAARLLAGLGRLGGDFQRNLEALPEIQDGESDLFESPCASGIAASLLARLQGRLLDLDVDLDSDLDLDGSIVSVSGDSADRWVRRDDDSIRIHVCHGPRRELEVVEAALRNAFARDDTLAPEDVIVMAPEIDLIAQDIEAVFGVSGDDPNGIPYRIADRGMFHRSLVAEAFRSLLGLLRGRAPRSEVLEWLAREPVRSRFGLEESDVERLADWAERAGIRFGLDAEHRKSLDLAPDRAHSLSGGLDRLALAHAVGASEEVFAEIVSAPLDAFSDPALLGALGDVESILSSAVRAIEEPRSVADWCSWLRSLLERTLARSDSNAHEHTMIRGVLMDLAKASAAGGFDHPIPFEAIRERIGDAIESTPSAQPFLSGGVTFCELVPLRAIPFRVIVLLGMSDKAFPRGGPTPGFDLMARASRAGDRTGRNDDRYLFLEALLSARDQLIVTVPGRDVRDGASLPPSVVLSDLLETLTGLFMLEPDEAGLHSLSTWLVVAHPLQASSPRYFEVPGDERLQGRDREAFAGARARRTSIEAGGGTPRRFLADSLPGVGVGEPAAEPEREMELETLIERFLHSTRSFSRDRLRLRLPRPATSLGDLDPVDLDPLAQYGLGAALLESRLSGAPLESVVPRLTANSSMPAGIAGRFLAGVLAVEVEELVRVGFAHCVGEPRADLEFGLDLEGVAGLGRCRLVGRLDQLWPDGRIEIGFSRIGRRGELALWIRHLVLCALAEDEETLVARSTLIGRGETKTATEHVVVFEKVNDPRMHLARLFAWAASAVDMPLPFFPKASRLYATKAIEGKPEQGWREAHQKFEGGDGYNHSVPESEEELEYARLWEGWSPLDSTGSVPVRFCFEELAVQFFEPLLAAREVHRR